MDTKKDFPLDLKFISGLIGGTIGVFLTILISIPLVKIFAGMILGDFTPIEEALRFIFIFGLIPSLIPSAILGVILGIGLARRRYSSSHTQRAVLLGAGLGGLISSVAGVVLMIATALFILLFAWGLKYG